MNTLTVVCPRDWSSRKFNNWLSRRFAFYALRLETRKGKPVRFVAVPGETLTQSEIKFFHAVPMV